ncbi:MAG TPA: hypothetical protein VGH88_20810, partial [Streptosporangiaceae bacterium]
MNGPAGWRRAVMAVLVTTVLVALAEIALTGLCWDHLATSDAVANAGDAAGAIAYAALGALIVHRTSNFTGWFMLAGGIGSAVMAAGSRCGWRAPWSCRRACCRACWTAW